MRCARHGAILHHVSGNEHRLEGGWQTEVTRRGTDVLRSSGPQSATVIALLQHLHANGFHWAPTPVGHGFAVDGRERLAFIEGESPQPAPWSDDAVWEVGRLLRRLHEAASTFKPDEMPTWRPWFARSLPGRHPVIGHGDLGPWNVLARDGMPVAFIDWDNAGPVDAHWELAQVAWLNAQLHDDDVADLNELGSAHARARQVRLLVDGYGMASSDRVGLVDRMIEFAVRATRDEAVAYDVRPSTTSPAIDGFPLVWGLAWRARAAAWMYDHRPLLEKALGL